MFGTVLSALSSNHLDEEERERENCNCLRSMALPRGVVGWSTVCDCGIS